MTAVPTHVHETIDDRLAALEQRHDVTVAFAVARGSHAWGAASPESDYDVGFVYVPDDLRTYAHLEGASETITDSGGDVEFQGLNVRKFAGLLADSNEGAIDLLRSPVRYRVLYDPDDLMEYITRAYNPIECYHDWRAIAANNYRKYLSDHLVRSDDAIFPILERTENGYVVEAADSDTGTMTIAADDERFEETRTRPTVKRNLTVFRAAMYARYLKETGERGDHNLPAIDFEKFLAEQAPAVFDADRIDRAQTLLERKRRGEGGVRVGDRVGREFAHPPKRIDPAVHVRDGPDCERLNAFIDDVIEAVR
ncbi:nucleotidyltransferase domain-containing protein [Halopiger xanaduensis]|uniref:Nucleotidyltransferase n=1 Tax=Halopiger xanaduensis (strain DSM 18323 / JCM 14033 / SH-6) TaxID=797210 RepID=F8D5Q0_HALXS|nr:nucleotidyltransferase domain-containing protein [Halopiger xanaduensis]AEH36472.1 Nucleotidyltransferase [Halopiger xanaduensis SH-6]